MASRMGASDVLLYENPYPDPNTYYPTGNPRRHHRKHRRNPSPISMVTDSFKGLNLMEMAAAVGGFAASAMLPGYILKPAAGGTLTQWQKAGKVAIAVGIAVVGKVVTARMDKTRSIGNAFMYGGIAGAGALALKEYTSIAPINSVRRIAPSNPVVPSAPSPAGMARATNQEFIPANAL